MVEPHREQPPERGGDGPDGAVVKGDEHLLGEQRVPLRDLDDAAHDVRSDRSGAVDGEALDVGGRERLEFHHVGGIPVGSSLNEVGTGKAQEKDRLGRLPRAACPASAGAIGC